MAFTAVAAALVAAAPSFAAGEPPPVPTRWVTDTAGFLSEPARQALDARLRDYEATTGHQVLVWIGRTTGDVPIEDFAVRAFKAWGVGQRGKDDGLVLFIFSEDRTARFEVGYGLEGDFPDVAASRVIREVLAPRLQTGDRDGAVTAAIEAATSTITRGDEGSGGAVGPAPPGPSRGRGHARPLSTAEKVVIGLVALAFIFILVTNPTLALYLLQVIASSGGGSRGGGWGGGGGGGWSGGGGRSGGGGASGSW